MLAWAVFALPADQGTFGVPNDVAFFSFAMLIFSSRWSCLSRCGVKHWLVFARASMLALVWLVLVLILATAAHFAIAAF